MYMFERAYVWHGALSQPYVCGQWVCGQWMCLSIQCKGKIEEKNGFSMIGQLASLTIQNGTFRNANLQMSSITQYKL